MSCLPGVTCHAERNHQDVMHMWRHVPHKTLMRMWACCAWCCDPFLLAPLLCGSVFTTTVSRTLRCAPWKTWTGLRRGYGCGPSIASTWGRTTRTMDASRLASGSHSQRRRYDDASPDDSHACCSLDGVYPTCPHGHFLERSYRAIMGTSWSRQPVCSPAKAYYPEH